MINKDSDMTSTPTTTTDRLYETIMKALDTAVARELKESDPAQYASIVEMAISLASQPNRIYQ